MCVCELIKATVTVPIFTLQSSSKSHTEYNSHFKQTISNYWKRRRTVFVALKQERERELALRTTQGELQEKLKEKEDEVRLAIEERELQKMAAVSGLDQQKDDLLQKIEVLNSVSNIIEKSG